MPESTAASAISTVGAGIASKATWGATDAVPSATPTSGLDGRFHQASAAPISDPAPVAAMIVPQAPGPPRSLFATTTPRLNTGAATSMLKSAVCAEKSQTHVRERNALQ